MQTQFRLFCTLLFVYLGKSNANTNTSSVSQNITLNNRNGAPENVLGKAVTPNPERNFNISSIIDLFTKTTTTTTSSPTSTTTTTTQSPTTTSCKCGTGAATARSIEEFALEDNENNHGLYHDSDDYFKIQNGTVAKNHGWPWSVAIVNESASAPRFARCGGSLISSNYILTAAHCFDNLSKANFLKDYKIYLGTNKINGNSSQSPVKVSAADFKVHPKYSASTTVPNFDVALIRLATPVTFNSSIQPVCLSQTGKPFASKNATAVGWGDQFFGQMKGSNVLRQVGLTIIGNTACNNTENGIITSQMLCAVGNPRAKGTCQGDSGGGLFFKKPTAKTYTVVGITSFGPVAGSCKSPAVFTRVSSVIDFIRAATMNSTTYCSNTFNP